MEEEGVTLEEMLEGLEKEREDYCDRTFDQKSRRLRRQWTA